MQYILMALRILHVLLNIYFEFIFCVIAKARKSIEQVLPGIGSVDVDLELDET